MPTPAPHATAAKISQEEEGGREGRRGEAGGEDTGRTRRHKEHTVSSSKGLWGGEISNNSHQQMPCRQQPSLGVFVCVLLCRALNAAVLVA